jgi:hypothetical protein
VARLRGLRAALLAAVAGIALALVAARMRPRTGFPLDAARCREARLDADGKLDLGDGHVVPAPAGLALDPGPVVVLLADDAGPFRGTPTVLAATEGTLEGLRLGPSLASSAWALSLAVLGVTPLLAVLLR